MSSFELITESSRDKASEVSDFISKLNKRARENVVFEHGLFYGALGRNRVCCYLHEDISIQPSDIHGILYEGFKESVSEKY
jgi:predicted nucleotide-binding protein